MLLAGTALGASPAHADDGADDGADARRDIIVSGELEDSTASMKTDTPIVEVPQPVTVVEDDLYLAQGALSVADTVRYVSGVQANPYGPDSRVDGVTVRGISALQFRDGMRDVFSFYATIRADPYNFSQVELVRGPASVLFGSGSLGGILNLVSKRPEFESQGEISLRYGSFDRKELLADVTGAVSDTLAGRLAVRVRDSGTQTDYVPDDRVMIAPSVRWQPTPDTDVTLLGLYQEDDGGSTSQFLPLVGTLLRRKPCRETASFSFPDFAALHGCMSMIASMKIEEKSFGLDLALSQGQIAKQDTGTMLAIARGVWKSSPNAATGVKSLVRMAVAGRGVLASSPYAAHFIADGHSMVEARAKIDAIRKVALETGREIANSVPTVVAAIPFQPLHNMLGPAGERWVPLHGLIPHSQVEAFHNAFSAMVALRRDEMNAKRVTIGAMFSSIGSGTFLYEPALYWEDTLEEYHERMMEPAYLATLPRYLENLAGRALVEELRTSIITLMQEHGAGHFQIGKLYPYTTDRDPGALALLRAIKRELDPDSRLNPGALGL